MFPPPYISWRPGIGDPDVVGWLTTIAYFVVAGAFLWAARRERRKPDRSPTRARVGTALGIVLTVLGLNKQLDCQTLIIEIGRHLALAHHWYAHRRLVEKAVAVAIGVAGLVGILRLRVGLQQGWHELPADFELQPTAAQRGGNLVSVRFCLLGITGASLLLAFVVIRAWPLPGGGNTTGPAWVGFHWYDAMELGGIGCLGAAWVQEARRRGV